MENIYATPEYKIFERKYKGMNMKHQNDCLDAMDMNDKLTICMPTGTGKSRVIYTSILDEIKLPSFDVFAIASHRLLLNVQHLKELFDVFTPILANVGFVFVGSYQISMTDFQNNVEINRLLSKYELGYKDLISTCMTQEDLDATVQRHLDSCRDVIIITTYHSLNKLSNQHLRAIYCDEAHFLATENDTTMFKENFEKVQADKSYFFTATPKDLVESDVETFFDSFLMNNETIFGKRVGITFNEALKAGLIVKPYIHIMEPASFKSSKRYSSAKNFANIVLDGFMEHEKTLKNLKACAPKILVKCPSVEMVWKIRDELAKIKDRDFKVFAGASYSPHSTSFCVDDEFLGGKIEFLTRLQKTKNSDKAIILHYDILSEGIDVPGITGVMFLSKDLPSKAKILQTIGRSTRLLAEDRKNMREGKIAVNDYDKMIKPYCAVMLPIMSDGMTFSVENIARMIIDLRDNFGFKPEMLVELGEDSSSVKLDDAMESLNKKKENDTRISRIGKIQHYIEVLDNSREIEMVRSEVKKMYGMRFDDVVKMIKEIKEFLEKNE